MYLALGEPSTHTWLMVYHGKNPKIILNYAPTMGMSEVFDSLALFYHTFWGSGCGDIQINLSRKMPNQVYLLFFLFFLGVFWDRKFWYGGVLCSSHGPFPRPPNPQKEGFFLGISTRSFNGKDLQSKVVQ